MADLAVSKVEDIAAPSIGHRVFFGGACLNPDDGAWLAIYIAFQLSVSTSAALEVTGRGKSAVLVSPTATMAPCSTAAVAPTLAAVSMVVQRRHRHARRPWRVLFAPMLDVPCHTGPGRVVEHQSGACQERALLVRASACGLAALPKGPTGALARLGRFKEQE